MTDDDRRTDGQGTLSERIEGERERHARDANEPAAPGREDEAVPAAEEEVPGEDASEPALDEREKRRADEEEDLTVSVTYEVIRRAGRDELRRSTTALAWSGLAAGLSMGFSMMTEAVLRAHLPDAEWARLVSKLGYTVGFLVVILGKQQLFTENTLTAVIPLLGRPSRDALLNTLRLWTVVLASNLAGTFVFALALGTRGLFPGAVSGRLHEIATEAMAVPSFGATFMLAVYAGWLIALTVWMLPAAREMSAIIIIVITWVVGVAGFPHIIAGSVDVFYAGIHGGAGWGAIAGRYLLPTLAGNTLGGVMLVSGLAHAQVVSGRRARRPR
jgi:formate-nitrite transporter family protein